MRWGPGAVLGQDVKVDLSNINAKAEGVRSSRPSAKCSSGGSAWCRSSGPRKEQARKAASRHMG